MPPQNSPSRARTYNLAVNSRSLYQLSYRGITPKSKALESKPEARFIIVGDSTDFNHFVKIYLVSHIADREKATALDARDQAE